MKVIHDPALLEDTADIVERMRLKYKATPMDAVMVLANALGRLVVTSAGCKEHEDYACPICASLCVVDIQKVILVSAYQDIDHREGRK